MIRDKLAQKITEIARTVLPIFAGDDWLNLDLTVLFPSLFLVNPATITDEDWRIVAEIKGTALIRFFSNERNPLDITPLLAILRDHVIRIEPDNNIEIGDYTVQFSWIPNEIKDELDYEDKIVPCLLGEFKNAFVMQKIAPVTIPNINTNIFVFFKNRTCLPVNIGKAKDMLCHLELKQVKIAVHDSIEQGYFSLIKSPNLNYYTLPDGNPDNVNLGLSKKDFLDNGYIQILENGRYLEKGNEVIYVDKNCFQYRGNVDVGDYFLILSPKTYL